MKPLHVAVILAGLLTAAATAQAPVDVRIALVIGNSAYPSAPLVNPANDARAMSDTLRGLGFTVMELRDGGKDQMTAAITKAREALQDKGGVGMLYYAGHGLQLNWRNYMVPVDANLANASDVPGQTLDVNLVIDAFRQAGNRMNILVLDACRDNPFAGTSGAKGLAQLDAPPGTFLAFATAPGNVAEDGDARSGNGLYTGFLLQEIRKPVSRIEDVFKRVRLQVRRQSAGRQIPWESTSLEDDFYFNTGTVVAVAKPDIKAREDAFLVEKTDWDKIRDTVNPEDVYAFLQKYPSGFITEQAQRKLEQLQKALTVAQADRDGVVAAPALRRVALGDEDTYHIVDGVTHASSRLVLKVTAADANRAEYNNGSWVWDQSGMLLKSPYGVHAPGVLQEPAGLALGKRWKTAYQTLRTNGSVETAFWDYRVTGYETVTVPQGTFKSFLVVGRGESRYPGGFATLESRAWFDPASGRRIRYEQTFRGNRGQVLESSVWEAVSFKRAAS